MPFTDDQKRAIQTDFAIRRRKQIGLAVPVVVILLLLVLSEGKQAVLGIPMAVVGPVAAVVVIAALVFSFYNWRCPGCRKYLGKGMSPKFCPKCGVQLS